MEYKIIISIVVVILSLVGYLPYIRDSLTGKTTPHTFSWFVWALGATITACLQIIKGAGVGAWVTIAVTIISWVIFIIGLFKKNKDIAWMDFVSLAAALGALYLWLVVQQPAASMILIVAVEVFGFIPTVRKSWNKPYTETLFSYEIHTIRHALSFFALESYNLVTWLFPVAWAVTNGAFALILTIRRRKIPPTHIQM